VSDYDGGTPASDFSTTDGVIDYTLPLGKVRLLILDTAEAPADRLFSEEQLDAFLELNDGNVRRTAAQALLVISLSEALLSKKIRTQDLSTDGPAVAAELRAQAKVLTDKADADDAAAVESFFDVVPFGGPCKPEGAEWRL
jgi:hypothetical protein